MAFINVADFRWIILPLCRPVGSDNPQLMNGHTQQRMEKLGLGNGCSQPEKEAAGVSMDRNGCKAGSFQHSFFFIFFSTLMKEEKKLCTTVMQLWEQIGSCLSKAWELNLNEKSEQTEVKARQALPRFKELQDMQSSCVPSSKDQVWV